MEPLFHIKEQLGAWQIDGDETKGRVQFKLFFPAGFDPKIREIRVAGDFQGTLGGTNWDFPGGLPMTRIDRPEGAFWSCVTDRQLPAGFYQYKYFVRFTEEAADPRKVSDPYARYGGTDHQNAAIVVGGSRPEDNPIVPLAERKHLRDLVVYEMHLDDFTDEFRGPRAPLDAVALKLDYLKSLGINAILFMPWTAWKHREFDWGYEPFQYFAVEYRYANDENHPEEKISWLKRMISACHEQGIHVILDGVFNHVSLEFPYKSFYLNVEDCPYTGKFEGEFSGLQDLDFENECTQDFIRDVCLYWIDTFKIDGIRFDNTTNYHRDSDAKGIPKLLEEIQAYLDAHGEKNFSMTLEHLNISAVKITKETKATSYWDNALYENCFQALWWNQIDSKIMDVFNNNRWLDSPTKVATIYLGNHDHSHVNWQAGARENAGALRWYKTQPYVIALLTCPGTPMIQNGQEFGEDHWIPENDEGTGRRVLPRPLHWKFFNDRIGHTLFDLYRRLIAFRKNSPALRSPHFYPQSWEPWQTRFNPEGYGVDTEKQVAIYHRWGQDAHGALQRVIIVLNFSAMDQDVTVPFSDNGTWEDLLSGWKLEVQNYRHSFNVGSNWGHVFVQ
jgi:pullulanase